MPQIGINPLPWYLTATGIVLTPEVLPDVYRAVRESGFGAVQADIPAGMTVRDLQSLLGEHELRAAPGYFSATFEEPAAEQARAHAGQQAALGSTEVFVAAAPVPARMTVPAAGHDFDAGRLATVIEHLGRACEAIVAEGLRPCLHPHVGTWIETEHETRAALDAIDPALLAFGPDVGHLRWAGMDPAAVITDYAERVGGVHLKDVHLAAVGTARERGDDYRTATRVRHVWTEPGHGDIDLAATLAALPEDYDGWFVLEVDVPDRGRDPQSSAVLCRKWANEHLAAWGQR